MLRQPNAPQTPWTLIAPTGSSILRTFSMNRTLQITRTPARAPIITAPSGSTKAQGAVIATAPASRPWTPVVGGASQKPAKLNHTALLARAAVARRVRVATEPIRRSVAARLLPGLNPNQPNARISVPSATIGTLWAGIALAEPF